MVHIEQLAGYASGPFLAACLLLVGAGISKCRNGSLPLGLVEIAVGTAGIVAGRGAALVVAATYLVLAAYSLRLLIVAPTKPCNCLGASSAPVTRGHVALNAGAAVVALMAAGGLSPFAQLSDLPLAGVPYLVLVACCTWLGVLMLTAYPALRVEQRRGAS